MASPDFTLTLIPAILDVKGKRRIFVAPAQNIYVLYRVPASTGSLTAK